MLFMHNFLEVTLYHHCHTCCFWQISWMANTHKHTESQPHTITHMSATKVLILVSFRERMIWGLMLMSDVPMLVWSNQPIPILIPILRLVSNLSYAMYTRWKIPKNATQARTESILSVHVLRFSAFFANPACTEYPPPDRLEPAFILSFCWTSTVGGRGRVCWSMWCTLSVWTRVGQSAWVLTTQCCHSPNITNIMKQSVSDASILKETMHHCRSLRHLFCQRSPFPVSCHEIWNHTV